MPLTAYLSVGVRSYKFKAEFYIELCGGLAAKLCSTLVTSWTIAWQAPLPMGFPRQKC